MDETEPMRPGRPWAGRTPGRRTQPCVGPLVQARQSHTAIPVPAAAPTTPLAGEATVDVAGVASVLPIVAMCSPPEFMDSVTCRRKPHPRRGYTWVRGLDSNIRYGSEPTGSSRVNALRRLLPMTRVKVAPCGQPPPCETARWLAM